MTKLVWKSQGRKLKAKYPDGITCMLLLEICGPCNTTKWFIPVTANEMK
jgi:hypothetical protein